MAYINQERFDQAKDSLKKALALKPRFSQAHFELGQLYLKEEKNDNIHTEEKKMTIFHTGKKMTIFHCEKKNDNIPQGKKMTIFCDIVILFFRCPNVILSFFIPLHTLVSLVSAVDYRGSPCRFNLESMG